jgi:hypothetical protein
VKQQKNNLNEENTFAVVDDVFAKVGLVITYSSRTNRSWIYCWISYNF